jgi:hypothetical protein
VDVAFDEKNALFLARVGMTHVDALLKQYQRKNNKRWAAFCLSLQKKYHGRALHFKKYLGEGVCGHTV